MPSPITNLADQRPVATATAELFEAWFDPIETAVRERVHGFIQAMSRWTSPARRMSNSNWPEHS